MRTVYLDCFAGISGNMLLGAFLQAGVPEAYLSGELSKLPLAEEYRLRIEDVSKKGIMATYVDVELTNRRIVNAVDRLPHHHGESDEHTHKHEHKHHDGHEHRTFADIRLMLEKSTLAQEVKQKSLAIFQNLAEAEGKVHGKPTDEVHFHEVGAVDSIVDIVGTAICLDYLEIEKVLVSKLNTGTGFVECAHGLMPVPAPATAELLKEIPAYHCGTPRELTTPTGAATVKTLAHYFESLPADFVVEKIAYGAGGWDLPFPNVLRVYIGDYQGAPAKNYLLMESNIDDMNPQIYGYLYELLFAAGALDVWTTAIYMKKNRPAQKLSVLVAEADQAKCAEIIFRETTSIGLRVMSVDNRLEATRHIAKVATKYGEVPCKVSAYNGHIVSVSPEYDACLNLAREKKIPLKVIRQEALKIMNERLGD